MNPVILATLGLLASPAAWATPLTPFHPGSSPCGGACGWDWARAAAGIPPGDPAPLVIPRGTVLVWMSYARDGIPHGGPVAMFAGDDLPGSGYPVGGGRWAVRIDACQNVAIAMMAVPASPLGAIKAPQSVADRPGLPIASRPGPVPQAATVGSVTAVWREPADPGDRPEDPGPQDPTPVPAPATFWLLGLALAALGLLSGRRS